MAQTKKNLNLFPFAQEIFNSLPRHERWLISPSNGNFIDSSKLVTRIIDFNQHNLPCGFVEAYKYNNSNRVAFIIIAIKLEFRKQGIAKSLIKQAEDDLRIKGYNKVIYRVDKTNIPSIRLAQKCKYKKIYQSKNYLAFAKELNKSE